MRRRWEFCDEFTVWHFATKYVATHFIKPWLLSHFESRYLSRPCVQNVPWKIDETSPACSTQGKVVQRSSKHQVTSLHLRLCLVLPSFSAEPPKIADEIIRWLLPPPHHSFAVGHMEGVKKLLGNLKAKGPDFGYCSKPAKTILIVKSKSLRERSVEMFR